MDSFLWNWMQFFFVKQFGQRKQLQTFLVLFSFSGEFFSTFLMKYQNVSTHSVVFDIQQREIRKKNFRKTKTWNCNNLLICLCHFSRRCASSTFAYNQLKTTATIILLTCLIWKTTSPTETIASTPETITSSDVMYKLTLWKLMTSKSRDWSRDLTSYSEPIEC